MTLDSGILDLFFSCNSESVWAPQTRKHENDFFVMRKIQKFFHIGYR